MERTDLIIKIVLGVLGGIASILTGLFGLFFTILLGLMAIDFITGVMAAVVSGEGLKSAKGYKGLFKKMYTLLLIGAVLMVEVSVLQTNGIVTEGVSTALIVIELVSIVENGNRMGIPLGFLSKFVATVRGKVQLLADDGKKKEDDKSQWTP